MNNFTVFIMIFLGVYYFLGAINIKYIAPKKIDSSKFIDYIKYTNSTFLLYLISGILWTITGLTYLFYSYNYIVFICGVIPLILNTTIYKRISQKYGIKK